MKFVERDQKLYERPDFMSMKNSTVRLFDLMVAAQSKTGYFIEKRLEYWKSYIFKIKK